MIINKDVAVPMSDGAILRVNIYRPVAVAPVILSMTPYGKDNTPDRLGMLAMRLSGVRFGHLNCSSLTGFESPDPQYWVGHGYAVVQGDTRGMHASDGIAGFLTDRDAQDYAEIIAWAAEQPWSSGAVGLNGVSYLCMSQWRVAALRPPGLRAMVAWEGASDLLREFAYHGGIPETGFIPIWWRNRIIRGSRRGTTPGEDFPRDSRRHRFDDEYWAAKRPDIGAINVPALVAASWSDHGLHTRGTLLAYEQLTGPKWLFIHGRRKWETYYSAEALSLQRRFLDRFLRGDNASWQDEPTVRYEVRRSRGHYTTVPSTSWPIANAQIKTLYLHADSMTMSNYPPPKTHTAQYHSKAKRRSADRLTFSHRFTASTEITGSMALTVWMDTDRGNDLDIFVVIRKRDQAGHIVGFIGYNGLSKDAAAKGWLRASHRELDCARSRPERPFHSHRVEQPITPGHPVALTIEIWPSSTYFEAGSEVICEIAGRDADRYPALRHSNTRNQGTHTVHTGPNTPSALTLTVVI